MPFFVAGYGEGIRCHDFRVDFCTRCYYANIPIKTLQRWMGHASMTMIMEEYAKVTKAEEEKDAVKLSNFMEKGLPCSANNSPMRDFRAL